jgi:hypothetical protein
MGVASIAIGLKEYRLTPDVLMLRLAESGEVYVWLMLLLVDAWFGLSSLSLLRTELLLVRGLVRGSK